MRKSNKTAEVIGPGDFISNSALRPRWLYWLQQGPRLLLLGACYLIISIGFSSANIVSLLLNGRTGYRPSQFFIHHLGVSSFILISLLAALCWWLNDLRRSHQLAPSTSQLTRSTYRRIRHSFTSVTTRLSSIPAAMVFAANSAIIVAVFTLFMSLLLWFNAAIDFSFKIELTLLGVSGLLCSFYIKSDCDAEQRVAGEAGDRILHYRGMALQRACQFYREVIYARAQYTQERELDDFPRILPAADSAEYYWINIKESLLPANTASTSPRRQNSLRNEDATGYQEDKIHDINDVSLILFGPNQSILIPDAQSAMRVDTSRSMINCMLKMEETASTWSVLRFFILNLGRSSLRFTSAISNVDEFLERKSTWVPQWVRVRAGSRATQLFDNLAHRRDYLEEIPSGVHTETLDDPHIIIEWFADPLIHEVFYQNVSRISYSDKRYTLCFGEQQLELELNLKNTQNRPFARKLLTALNSRVEQHQQAHLSESNLFFDRQ